MADPYAYQSPLNQYGFSQPGFNFGDLSSLTENAPSVGSPSALMPGNKFDMSSLFGVGGPGPGAGGSGLGWNLPTLNAGIQGFGQLASLFLGIKQLGLAKDQFKLSKEAYRTNLRNQTQSYNTQVADRIAGRSYGSEEERQAALRAAQLPTTGY